MTLGSLPWPPGQTIFVPILSSLGTKKVWLGQTSMDALQKYLKFQILVLK